MRSISILICVFLAACGVVPALASFSGGPKDEKPASSSTSATASAGGQMSNRQEAEKWYGDAYGDVAKANQAVTAGKTKDAEKKFKRALERGERAAGLDTTYYEALNLVGYCARNLKQYDKSLAAYTRCLSLKEDYAPAREYLGELYVEMGDLDKAREQLAWLERLEASESVTTLKTKIDAKLAATNGVSAPAPAEAADTLRTSPHR